MAVACDDDDDGGQLKIGYLSDFSVRSRSSAR